ELALQLDVSRPSLREGLIALEIEGRVEIRMGSGIYVCAPPSGGPQEPLALGESPSELMQARSVLEGSIITLAVARATRPGLDQVKACLDAMRQDVRRGQSPVEADRRFHVAIAEMTGNSVLARMVSELFDGRHGLISARMSRHAENATTWESALREHEAIYRALESRDPQEAAAAMFGHLTASRERWTEEGPGAPEPA
ncbi:MAG TPA: FCD domain-containing protein, partial [Albitalea sp.]|nr:FCD domain-containing protein [Albitalea sp.]